MRRPWQPRELHLLIAFNQLASELNVVVVIEREMESTSSRTPPSPNANFKKSPSMAKSSPSRLSMRE